MDKASIEKNCISILFPDSDISNYQKLSDLTMHDLGMDAIVKKLTSDPKEQAVFFRIMTGIHSNPEVSKFRIDVFEDIYSNPEMREHIMKLLDHIDFLREYGTFKRTNDETAGVWDLLHRMYEIQDYIQTVEAIHGCLCSESIFSDGLLRLKSYIEDLYNDNGFAALKKDIEELKATTSNLKSVTLGINLNERFEAQQIGLISINSKPFTKAPMIANLFEHLSKKDDIDTDIKWNDDYHFQPISEDDGALLGKAEKIVKTKMVMANPLLAFGMGGVPNGDEVQTGTHYLDRIANKMISISVNRLRETLARHSTIQIVPITSLIPEFLFYIRWAEFIEKYEKKGFSFSKAEVGCETNGKGMQAEGIYNLKLAFTETEESGRIVPNNLDFSDEHLVYILTGANRGGKTTITQAIGILFVLAQCGIRVPGKRFRFDPVDNIFTHFPADEDKTMDLGRLGEECSRFREIYQNATEKSLLLLNETFSTTSFEEGYFIACDALKAVLNLGIRTIYNTHMHKIAYMLDELNQNAKKGKIASLIVKAENGQRSYRIMVAPPEGMSFAHDIALKYGVTYEDLVESHRKNIN